MYRDKVSNTARVISKNAEEDFLSDLRRNMAIERKFETVPNMRQVGQTTNIILSAAIHDNVFIFDICEYFLYISFNSSLLGKYQSV